MNLVIFLNCPHNTCTWFGVIFPHVFVHHGPPFSILGEGCACLLPPSRGSGEGCLAQAQPFWYEQGQVGEPSTEQLGGARAGVSHGSAGNFFCLWKYHNLSDKGTRGETSLCLSAKVHEKVWFPVGAEAGVEAFTKDFLLQSNEEHACFTDFCSLCCLGQKCKEAWSLTWSLTHAKALTVDTLRTNLYFYWNTFSVLDEGRWTSGKSCASKQHNFGATNEGCAGNTVSIVCSDSCTSRAILFWIQPCLLFQFVMHDLSFCHLLRTLGTSWHKKKLKHNTDESALYCSLDL